MDCEEVYGDMKRRQIIYLNMGRVLHILQFLMLINSGYTVFLFILCSSLSNILLHTKGLNIAESTFEVNWTGTQFRVKMLKK